MHRYARQYIGKATPQDTCISPGNYKKRAKASPKHGYRIIYGAEEFLAVRWDQKTVDAMTADGATVEAYVEEFGIHAWPVVKLFLGESHRERLKGLGWI